METEAGSGRVDGSSVMLFSRPLSLHSRRGFEPLTLTFCLVFGGDGDGEDGQGGSCEW